MRIIAGKFKGLPIYGPKDKKIRPLKDLVRENIFNFLVHSNKISFKIEKTNVLDLYSGTGSFGLECISRGALKVTFIEKEKEAVKILEKNIQKLKVNNETKIFYNDVFSLIKNKTFFNWSFNAKFDLVFCDPPFKDENIDDLIKLIIEKNLLKKDGIITIHRHKNSNEKFTKDLKVIDTRLYGLSKIIFGKIVSYLS
tara:strand:- start:44 stop:634 length:591 start_codon:yes stop_codon:yes gene_type:complete